MECDVQFGQTGPFLSCYDYCTS